HAPTIHHPAPLQRGPELEEATPDHGVGLSYVGLQLLATIGSVHRAGSLAWIVARPSRRRWPRRGLAHGRPGWGPRGRSMATGSADEDQPEQERDFHVFEPVLRRDKLLEVLPRPRALQEVTRARERIKCRGTIGQRGAEARARAQRPARA